MEHRTPRHFRPLRTIALAGMALAALVIGGTSARAQTQSFDASICPEQDTDKFAVRLVSGLGFLVEPSSFLAMQPHNLPDVDPALPPDGCVGNPAILRSITFPFDYDAALSREDRPTMANMRPSRLTIFGHGGPGSDQRGTLSILEKFRHLVGNCLVTADSLEICLSCSKDSAPWCSQPVKDGVIHPEITAWYGRALPNSYEEYEGLPYVISCRNMFSQSVWCDVGKYQLSSGLWFHYQFKSKSISIDNLLNFDKEVRRQIMAMRAPELDGKPFHSGE